MPEISSRSGINRTREGRLSQQRKGPGVFVFRGSVDVSLQPTPLLFGRMEQAIGMDGVPVVDASGRPVYERPGTPVRDMNGRIVLGGDPKRVETTIDTMTIWGETFVKDQPRQVADPVLALKLRGMKVFDEVEAAESTEDAPAEPEAIEAASPSGEEAPVKRGPGRPRKVKDGE